MDLKKCLLLYLCTAGLLLCATAQEEINFTALTTKDGLSSNTVNVILKDRYGLLWFGTEDGLDKFDGTNFKVYRHKPGDSTTLEANEVLSLHEDKSGNLWIGTSGGSVSLYDRKKDAFINYPSGDAPGLLKNNVVRAVRSDYLGNIWVIHYGGFDVLDPKTGKTVKIPLNPAGLQSIPTDPALTGYEDSKHRMWIGTDNGLLRYDPATRILRSFYHSDHDPSSLSNGKVMAIAEDSQGSIWIGTSNGLSKYIAASDQFVTYRKTGANRWSLSSNNVNSIAVENDKLWLGMEDGLNILDIKTGEVRKAGFDYRNIHSLNAPSVRTVYIDNQGIYWLGMVGGGINKFDKNLNLFNFVKSNEFDERGLKASFVSSFAEDNAGNVLVGTEGGGLSLFNPATRLFRQLDLHAKGKSAGTRLNILSLKMTRKNELMIGTFSDGLFVFNPSTQSYQQFVQGNNPTDLNANDIFCIEEDRKGNIWVGMNGEGVNILKDNKVITRYTPNPQRPNDIILPINGYIRDIEEDSEGNIWIATHGGGIAVLDPSTGKFTIYNTINGKLPNDKVQTLQEDQHGNIWAGTFGGGLAAFRKGTDQPVIFSEKEGLQNNAVYEILEDEKGLIWVSTNKGISSIDFATKKINNYTYHNGVQNNNFIPGSGIRLGSGELFFGGVEGFNYFNPANLKKNNNIPTALITDLRISNQSVNPSEDGPIKEHISVAKEIDLNYKQNFALSFVGLNYTSPVQNQYAYKLEGFDKDWNYVGNTTTASYTNLDPGEYVFRVRASNNDGVWNNEGASIKIYVHPPFWRSTYAYILYALALLGLLFYLRYTGIRKIKRKHSLEQIKLRAEQDRKEAERVHELDMLKLKFLTNLSHEFRTPISLILGPTEKLLTEQKNEQASGQLNMIRRNAKRLLNLVNQLLDFRKMEEQELKLHAAEGELVSFIQDTCDSFKDISERKKIGFTFKTNIPQLHTSFDHDKMERILFNILSNAFKFTLEGGKIALELSEMNKLTDPQTTWVSLKVSDTGIGIPADKKEKIFDRFFQHPTTASILNQGSGIGLSITKEFIKMQGGEIEVESEPEKGTTFSIHLPFIRLNPSGTETALSSDPADVEENAETLVSRQQDQQFREMNPAAGNTEMPLVLIVEDNEDFRFYLKDNLRLHYKIVEAADGKQGWHEALALHPQLIVSDINMPGMDGIELTKKIKSDKRTSHIPIILLTALTGEQEQLKGLGTGANDYITKPFNFEVLNVKIRNLLALNLTLKNTYTKQIKVLSPEVKIESDDEKLLKEVMIYLEENLTNSKLSVEELSRHVGMSRSTLYGKILELTGETPVEFIRSFKLDRAAVLLEKSEQNVAQIAYSVGFSTPNYFAKSFKAKFNILPSEFISKMRKNGRTPFEPGSDNKN